MFKSLITIAGASALVMGSGTAYAIPNHVYSPTNPLALDGVATLGSNVCFLNLVATLDDTDAPATHIPADWYNVITNLTGTNDMSQSDPGCAGISIVGGTGSVTGSNSISLSSLIIRIVTGATTYVDCPAGTVAVAVTNDTPTTVNAVVSQTTPCGAISADLYGVGQIN